MRQHLGADQHLGQCLPINKKLSGLVGIDELQGGASDKRDLDLPTGVERPVKEFLLDIRLPGAKPGEHLRHEWLGRISVLSMEVAISEI